MKPGDLQTLYGDPRHYDAQYAGITEDVDFYLRQMEKYGEPVLELGCGTGRIAIAAARRGFRITGLDITESMLACGREKARAAGVDIDWVLADCRDFDLARTFRMIFFPANSILHLHERSSFEACFSCVRGHLADAGRFVFDVFVPSLAILTRDPNERFPCHEYEDPDGKGMVRISESSTFDMASQINRARWYMRIGDGEEHLWSENNVRVFFPQELDALFHYNGFEIEAKYGAVDETPFTSRSRSQIVVCRKR